MRVKIDGLGTITASKETLNMISIYAKEAETRYKLTYSMGLAREAEKVSEQIYEALKETGYYDDCKTA